MIKRLNSPTPQLLSSKAALLIEVLFALTILAFGVTACLRAMAQGLEITKRSQEYYLAESALDDLFFRLISGADEDLLYDGGEGEFDLEHIDLPDLRYVVESQEISPFVPPSEEELEALRKAGEEPPPPDPFAEVEENYRILRVKAIWRNDRADLDYYTIVRVPHQTVKKPSLPQTAGA